MGLPSEKLSFPSFILPYKRWPKLIRNKIETPLDRLLKIRSIRASLSYFLIFLLWNSEEKGIISSSRYLSVSGYRLLWWIQGCCRCCYSKSSVVVGFLLSSLPEMAREGFGVLEKHTNAEPTISRPKGITDTLLWKTKRASKRRRNARWAVARNAWCTYDIYLCKSNKD